MRRFVAVAVATLGLGGVLLSSQVASADQVKGSIGLKPDSGRPGDSITLFGECTAPGFSSTPLRSEGAFEPMNVTLVDHSPGNTGPATDVWAFPVVAKDAKPGKYTVSYKCGPYNEHMTFTVLPAATEKPAPTTTTTTTRKPAPKPAQVTVKPKGAADTGDGSTAE
jgi:hypothetical protein